ncbi:MAG: hypothetical protein M3O67_07450 [Bacteroidota bacterium]|nr:hypothetical protein [Bacteroidota bacterium]
MGRLCFIALTFIVYNPPISAQSLPINRQLFFLDDKVIEVTFTTDIKKLINQKKLSAWQPADITMQLSDTSAISEKINVRTRGIYRKQYCDIASLMLNFKNLSASRLSPLKELKLVGGCSSGKANEELLLKEYLVYKIFNFISMMSFRVRLLHINYKDSKQKARPYSQYAFLIEDIKDLCARNNCIEKKNKVYGLDEADRQQFNGVCLFQYMIGNTDWSVRQYHNIKLMVPKNDTLARPYVVPYDFDYAGLVNAPYAIPNDGLGITSVTERLYRGFARTMNELQANLTIYKEKKDAIMLYLTNFPLLAVKVKRDMIWYLEKFYEIIDDKNSVRSVFITNARTN